jgi:hypothetical protein
MVFLEVQSFRDQFNRNIGVVRKDLVKQNGRGSRLINDADSDTHIDRQMLSNQV